MTIVDCEVAPEIRLAWLSAQGPTCVVYRYRNNVQWIQYLEPQGDHICPLPLSPEELSIGYRRFCLYRTFSRSWIHSPGDTLCNTQSLI